MSSRRRVGVLGSREFVQRLRRQRRGQLARKKTPLGVPITEVQSSPRSSNTPSVLGKRPTKERDLAQEDVDLPQRKRLLPPNLFPERDPFSAVVFGRRTFIDPPEGFQEQEESLSESIQADVAPQNFSVDLTQTDTDLVLNEFENDNPVEVDEEMTPEEEQLFEQQPEPVSRRFIGPRERPITMFENTRQLLESNINMRNRILATPPSLRTRRQRGTLRWLNPMIQRHLASLAEASIDPSIPDELFFQAEAEHEQHLKNRAAFDALPKAYLENPETFTNSQYLLAIKHQQRIITRLIQQICGTVEHHLGFPTVNELRDELYKEETRLRVLFTTPPSTFRVPGV